MKAKHALILVLGLFAASSVHAWEATVTQVLHHGSVVAVYLSPDPGRLSCSFGQPYLVTVDDTTASKQRFAILMTALTTGQLLVGFDDGCDSSIWGQSRPTLWRLALHP